MQSYYIIKIQFETQCSFLFERILALAYLIEIQLILLLQPFDQSFLLLIGQGVEYEDRFIPDIILHRRTKFTDSIQTRLMQLQ